MRRGARERAEGREQGGGSCHLYFIPHLIDIKFTGSPWSAKHFHSDQTGFPVEKLSSFVDKSTSLLYFKHTCFSRLTLSRIPHRPCNRAPRSTRMQTHEMKCFRARIRLESEKFISFLLLSTFFLSIHEKYRISFKRDDLASIILFQYSILSSFLHFFLDKRKIRFRKNVCQNHSLIIKKEY